MTGWSLASAVLRCVKLRVCIGFNVLLHVEHCYSSVIIGYRCAPLV